MYKRFTISVVLLGCMLSTQLQSAWAQPSSISSNQVSDVGPLSDLVRRVIQNHPRARSVDAALKVSSAKSEAANQPLYNPELEVEAERTDINTISLGLSQTIDWSDKRDANAKAAMHEHNAVVAEANSQRQELAIELLKALGEYHTASTINKHGQRRLQLMQQFSSIAEKRHRAGDLDQIELDLAKLAVLEASLESAELASRLSDAEQGLLSLLGEQPTPSNWPTLPESGLDLQHSTDDTEALLREHPRFKAKQALTLAARSTIDVRQREARPDPTISIRTGREDDETLTGLSLSLPLFVRNGYHAEIDEASAKLVQTEQDAQATWLNLNSQLTAATQRYKSTRATWSIWQQQGETPLNRRTELLEKIWQAGELGTTDYLVQIKQTLVTQSAATALRGRLWSTWLDWLSASGTVFKWLSIENSRATAAMQK